MKIVTSGAKYLDIDAYGGCIAYAELLNLLKDPAIAVSTAPLNESIPPSIREWSTELKDTYTTNEADQFILVDISDPAYFDSFVTEAEVVEIIDHHMEFADYWKAKLGATAHIEFIGAACTLVFERWQGSGLLPKMSVTSAKLLAAGILDNTLNFKAQVSTERDKKAYAALSQQAKLPANWDARYFEECQLAIMGDVTTAVENDLKTLRFPSLAHDMATGQLVVWDARSLLQNSLDAIQETMLRSAGHWFMNIVSIAEGRNYLLASDAHVQEFLERLTGASFEAGTGVTDRLWLRKEIMKEDIDIAITEDGSEE